MEKHLFQKSTSINTKNKNKKMSSSKCHRKSLMLSILWIQAVLSFMILPERMTALTALITQTRKLRQKGRKLDLYYLHDYVPIHISVVSRDTIEGCGLNVILHPLYSPGLTPSDFYLFYHHKKTLKGQQFPNKE